MSGALPALPDRPLHARPPGAGWYTGIMSVLGILLFLAALVWGVGWVLPDVVTDWQVRDAAVPIRGSRIENGKCSSKLFIEICDMTLHARTPGREITRDVHYLFASFHTGAWTVGVVGDPARPDWLTTDLGLDYFWNRVLTLAAAFALVAALLVGGAFGKLRTRRAHASWRTLPTVPVPLELTQVQRLRNGVRWTVRGETGATAQWVVPARAKPFPLGPDRILGLAGRDGAALFPLDAGLRWVDLTPSERASALAAGAGR